MNFDQKDLFQLCEDFLKKNNLDQFELIQEEDGLYVIDPSGREFTVDFDENKKDYSRKNSQGGHELLLKALAGDKKFRNVLDLSAGLAIDSVFLSQSGFQVTALERNPVLYLLLTQALEKTTRSDLSELRFILSDSGLFLKSLPEDHFYQVAYFDPMYPEKRKSALPRKEMQIFRQLVGSDEDSQEILKLALQKNFQRVVVKRPLKSEFLLPGVIHSFKGTTVRYDLYVQR